MSDLLLEIGERPLLRRLVKGLSLPLPIPQPLRRASGPYAPRPLRGQRVAFAPADPRLAEVCARALAAAGATTLVPADAALPAEGEAWGRPPGRLEGDGPLDAIVFDATGLRNSAELAALHGFFQPLLPRLKRCGRCLLLTRPPAEEADFVVASTQRAVEGFTRSLARELGRKGATANLVTVPGFAAERLAGPLRFLLSARSAYISGQVLGLSAAVVDERVPPEERPLEGQTALVTGAARGIGAAIARRLADEGARLWLLDRPEEDGPLARLARELRGEVVLCDLTAEDAPARIVAELGERLDIVVHNAGITRDKTLVRMAEAHWNQVLAVNLEAIQRLTRALLDGPLQDHGRVLALTSIAGIAGNAGQTNYSAAKAGVIGLVRNLAGPLAARGITVNAVAPGFIETRLTARMPVGIREVARRLNSLGQGGLPADVAEAITFLATPAACGLTGQVLRVCGGALLGA